MEALTGRCGRPRKDGFKNQVSGGAVTTAGKTRPGPASGPPAGRVCPGCENLRTGPGSPEARAGPGPWAPCRLRAWQGGAAVFDCPGISS